MNFFKMLIAILLISSANAFAVDFKTHFIKDIEKEISNLGPLGAYELEIIDQHGAITLNGFVSSPDISSKIENAASGVKGVVSVRNQLQIKPQVQQLPNNKFKHASEMPDDMQLLRSVKQSLVHESDIDVSKLGINVRDGVVYFSGSLNNHREVDRILSHTLMIDGVKDISSNLTIKGQEYR